MKLYAGLEVNGRVFKAGDEISPWSVYPFFLLHMLMFGGAGFMMAYGADAGLEPMVYFFGAFAILCYCVFYRAIFGPDEVRWMFINAGIGILGIVSQINWILSLFGRSVADYPPQAHIIPIIYFVMYTFLIRHAILDLSGVREDDVKRPRVEWAYVVGMMVFYLAAYLVETVVA